MKTWPPEKLKKGDLVLMEVQVSRYSPSKGEKTKKARPEDMTDWRTTFDLIAVSLLEIGPTIPDADDIVSDFKDADFSL